MVTLKKLGEDSTDSSNSNKKEQTVQWAIWGWNNLLLIVKEAVLNSFHSFSNMDAVSVQQTNFVSFGELPYFLVLCSLQNKTQMSPLWIQDFSWLKDITSGGTVQWNFLNS